MEPAFSFTSEQKDNLNRWTDLLQSEQAQTWAKEAKAAIEAIHQILRESEFQAGNDLISGQLDSIFHYMRDLMPNRSLARNLYEDNGLANFNSRLRKLFFGTERLAERVDQFLELKRVGVLTVSQFLCVLDPREYPEITAPTLEVLNLDAAQIDDAYRQALRQNDISSPQNYHTGTLEYLQDAVIFREVKNLLNIEHYYGVNDLLWLARQQVLGEMKPTITSVSLEKDLRDYLAQNPIVIESGLSLVGKEYPISGAGKSDLLCQDKRGNYVVIEMKKDRESDKVVGQILRYIGGLKKEGKRARGIIIVNEPDDKLDFAIEAVKDFVKLKYYKVKFDITDNYES